MPKGRIGPGKIALLEQIDLTGSISAAGRALGMSYRRAWLLVDELNRLFAAPVVTTQMGGSHGGGAALTTLGNEIVTRFRALERAAEPLVPSIWGRSRPWRSGTPARNRRREVQGWPVPSRISRPSGVRSTS